MMPLHRSPSPRSVLASVLAAAGIVLTATSCSGHLAPLGPHTVVEPSHLRSPIVLQAMRVQPPAPAGTCPAGFTKLAAPGIDPACYRPLGAPVTFTSAAVALGPAAQPVNTRNASPSVHELLIAVPAADQAALTAVTTQAYDSRGAVDVSVAGKTWALPLALAPITHGQFAIALPSTNEVLQLQRILVSGSPS